MPGEVERVRAEGGRRGADAQQTASARRAVEVDLHGGARPGEGQVQHHLVDDLPVVAVEEHIGTEGVDEVHPVHPGVTDHEDAAEVVHGVVGQGPRLRVEEAQTGPAADRGRDAAQGDQRLGCEVGEGADQFTPRYRLPVLDLDLVVPVQ